MPLVFRKIKKSKWYKNDAVPWLASEDLQADALADLATMGNALSVYLLEEDDQESLERLLTALAMTRESVRAIDYALFAGDALSDLGFKIANNDGDTPDAVVNSWHRHLIELSADKIMSLAIIIRNDATKKRVLEKRVRSMVIEALPTNRIDRSKVKFSPELIAELVRA